MCCVLLKLLRVGRVRLRLSCTTNDLLSIVRPGWRTVAWFRGRPQHRRLRLTSSRHLVMSMTMSFTKYIVNSSSINLTDTHHRSVLPNRTEFINFSERDLINNDSSFCSLILSAIDLQCHLMSVFVCKQHFDLHVTMLQYWPEFSNGLVRWSIRMICAKN